MASSKSRKTRRRRKRKQKQSAELRRKLAQGPFRDIKVVTALPGEVKMSEVLGDFVEPYVELAETEEAYRRLLVLAVTAWNASFLSKKEQQEMIDNILDQGIPEGTEELKAGLKGIINMLIERKKRRFSQYKRHIIDFELTDTGRGYHLTVISTLDKTPM